MMAEGLVAKLTPLHGRSAWGSKEERVWSVGLVACYNYSSKKKKVSMMYNGCYGPLVVGWH